MKRNAARARRRGRETRAGRGSRVLFFNFHRTDALSKRLLRRVPVPKTTGPPSQCTSVKTLRFFLLLILSLQYKHERFFLYIYIYPSKGFIIFFFIPRVSRDRTDDNDDAAASLWCSVIHSNWPCAKTNWRACSIMTMNVKRYRVRNQTFYIILFTFAPPPFRGVRSFSFFFLRNKPLTPSPRSSTRHRGLLEVVPECYS